MSLPDAPAGAGPSIETVAMTSRNPRGRDRIMGGLRRGGASGESRGSEQSPYDATEPASIASGAGRVPRRARPRSGALAELDRDGLQHALGDASRRLGSREPPGDLAHALPRAGVAEPAADGPRGALERVGLARPAGRLEVLGDAHLLA